MSQSDLVRVAIVMGSDSDLPVMKQAKEALEAFSVGCEMRVLSAHRTPEEASKYARDLASRGVKIVIAGAGMAAHLAGAFAAHTTLPIIGVPLASGPLKGQDSLLSTVMMPKGLPVATVAVDGAYNAGILAVQILATGDADESRRLADALRKNRQAMKEKILAIQI